MAVCIAPANSKPATNAASEPRTSPVSGRLKDSLTPSTRPVSASFAMEAIPRSAPPHSACTGVNWSEVMVAVTAAAGAAAATESAARERGARRARLEGTRRAPETNADRWG